jgi:hypothetical protein
LDPKAGLRRNPATEARRETVAETPAVPYAIEIEALRDRFVTSTGDSLLARALGDGVPAAWALFQDVVRPRLVAAIGPLCADPREADAVSERTAARLFRERVRMFAAVSRNGSLSLFDRCLAVALVELDAVRRGADPGIDPLAAATRLGELPTGGDPPLLAEFLARAAALPASARRPDLRADAEVQRESVKQRRQGARILNLPAVLALVFLALISVTTLFILDQPEEDRATIDRARIAEYVIDGRFDDAVRLLADSPPPGLEGLMPVLPETRFQRLRALRARASEPPRVALTAPLGKIDDPTPTLCFRLADPTQAYRIRLVDSGAATIVLTRDMKDGALTAPLGPEVKLIRGAIYTVLVEWNGGGARFQFEVLTEDASRRIEDRVASVIAGFESSPPQLVHFLKAHVLRAEQCFMASIHEWRALAERFPGLEYPREEAASVFDVELRQPALALEELTAR